MHSTYAYYCWVLSLLFPCLILGPSKLLLFLHISRTFWYTVLIFNFSGPPLDIHSNLFFKISTVPLIYLYIIVCAIVTYMFIIYIVQIAPCLHVMWCSFYWYIKFLCSSVFLFQIPLCTSLLVTLTWLFLILLGLKVKVILHIVSILLYF